MLFFLFLFLVLTYFFVCVKGNEKSHANNVCNCKRGWRMKHIEEVNEYT